MNNLDKSNEGFIVEATKTLERYVGEPNTKEIYKTISEDLNRCLDRYLTDYPINETKYPIEFENEIGKWKIMEDGETYIQHYKPVKSITVNFTIKTEEDEQIR
jgi:hypothetical protein